MQSNKFASAMIEIPGKRSAKPVATWLLIGVGMIIVQILLGGITRLTGSGLSITEWDVITGALPPMDHNEWMQEFDKYKQTPQFHLLNSDFTLKDFKFIFFWEWFHRFWGRLIGVVFAIPFVIFLIQKRFTAEMVKPLLILFLLGALQGAVGWIMVASGLEGDAIYVKPTRLALHFIFAMGLLCYTFWFALELLVPKDKLVQSTSLRKQIWIILIVLTIQFIFGALMAGHKAANVSSTWPSINGYAFPSGMFNDGAASLLENRITIQFIHRGLAYILFILVCIFTWKAYRFHNGSSLFNKSRWMPAFIVLLQVILGILTVMTSVNIVPNRWGIFEWMAQLHQLVAMFLLLSLVWMLYIVRNKH